MGVRTLKTFMALALSLAAISMSAFAGWQDQASPLTPPGWRSFPADSAVAIADAQHGEGRSIGAPSSAGSQGCFRVFWPMP